MIYLSCCCTFIPEYVNHERLNFASFMLLELILFSISTSAEITIGGASERYWFNIATPWNGSNSRGYNGLFFGWKSDFVVLGSSSGRDNNLKWLLL